MRVALLALPACAPPLADGVDPAHDLSAYLTEASADLPERARSLGDARGALTPDGELFGGEPWSSGGTWVVGDARSEVLVIWTAREIQIGAWLDRADLDLVMAEPAWVGGQGSGVRLPAGEPVERRGRSGDRVRVRAAGWAVEVDGWTQGRFVDEVWTQGRPSPQVELGEGTWARIRSGTELWDSPGGEPIGRVLRDEELFGVWSETQSGFGRVRGQTGDWLVDAWVPIEALEVGWLGGIAGSAGHLCGGGFGRRGPPSVRADAWLRLTPGGAPIGRTRVDTSLDLDAPATDWARAAVHTPFGTAWLWVDPADRLP